MRQTPLRGYSPDGRTWTRAKVDDAAGRAMDQVVATDHGFVAIGEAEYSFHAGFGGGAAIWTSPDGRTWTRAHDKRTPPRGTALGSVVAGAGGFLAKASFEYSEGNTKPLPPVTAGIWRSTDAIHWEPIPGTPLGVAQIVEVSDGFVAIGSKDTGDRAQPVSWRSPDGRSWTSVEVPPRSACRMGPPSTDSGWSAAQPASSHSASARMTSPPSAGPRPTARRGNHST